MRLLVKSQKTIPSTAQECELYYGQKNLEKKLMY